MKWRAHGAKRRVDGNERGAALVEFVLVLPLVLLLLFGMVDFGKAFNYWNDETHLANEAARYAVVNKNPLGGPDLETAVKQDADSGELKNGCTGCSVASPGIKVSFCFVNGTTPADTAAGQPLRATVSADYHWLAFLVGNGLPVKSGITGSAVMRIEQPYTDSPLGSGDYSHNTYLRGGPVKCS